MEGVSQRWNPSADGESKWAIFRDSMVKAAETVLGKEKRRQPDWFQENIEVLKKLIVKRNGRFVQWLETRHPRDRQKYVAQRREVAREVRCAKNRWFQQKAGEVERAVRGGKGVWKGLREMQRGRAGLRPRQSCAVKDCDGELCIGQDNTLKHWHQHFSAVLNICSTFNPSVVEATVQHPVQEDLAEPPTEEEIMQAIGRLKCGRAGGKSGILPEMVKGCGGEMMDHIIDLFATVWREEEVPQDWRDALLVPIPKKGDLTQCDNWRGISLLDCVGKVFAKVIQTRLQKVVEDVLPDSQCGFRAGRGCSDMIFCARQLMEKAREHNTKLYLFVDLRKAYDSVPRQTLWAVLRKYGIPPPLVNIIQSLHDGMKAEVTVNGATTDSIDVTNGLRQGCTIAPTLFNLYFNLVIAEWRRRCGCFGAEVLYKCAGKLVGERTRRPLKTTVTELQFADDAALVGISREEIERAARVLDEVTSEWGLTVSLPKTKLLVVGASVEEDLQPISIRDEFIEVVSEFRYLGAIVEACGGVVNDMADRIARASRAFGALCKPVFKYGGLSLATKRMVYRAVVLGVLLYGAEAWVNKSAATR